MKSFGVAFKDPGKLRVGNSGIYYDLEKIEIERSELKDSEVAVKILSAALNHRDLYIRSNLHPSGRPGIPILSDGCGIVIKTGDCAGAKALLHKRVVVVPVLGWQEAPEGPEDLEHSYGVVGGSAACSYGTLMDTLILPYDAVELAPDHLNDAEAAAIPLAGLTAWRALNFKSSNFVKGRNILITGIGGGVALFCLQFALTQGCRVFVTSGSEEKLKKAKDLGAYFGVNYHNSDWHKQLIDVLPDQRKFIDAVIDGAGGDIVSRCVPLLKPGGIIVSYGMTLGPRIDYSMLAVVKNIELRGSTMGSKHEFSQMLQFVRNNSLHPVISRICETDLDNFQSLNLLFDEMKSHQQFGKLVLRIQRPFPDQMQM